MMSGSSAASSKQLLQLCSLLAQNLPTDLSPEIAAEWIDEPKALQKLLENLRAGTCPLLEVKRRFVEVKIYPARSIEEWIEVRKSDCNHDPDITPSVAIEFLSVRPDAIDPYKARLVAFNLGFPVGTKKVMRVRERLRLKPVGFEHEAALSEQRFKVVQRLGTIVNLDFVIPRSIENVNGPFHSCLRGKRDHRNPMNPATFEWDKDVWFLGLRDEE